MTTVVPADQLVQDLIACEEAFIASLDTLLDTMRKRRADIDTAEEADYKALVEDLQSKQAALAAQGEKIEQDAVRAKLAAS
jgi:hypothetical protein